MDPDPKKVPCDKHPMNWSRRVDRVHDEYKCRVCGHVEVIDALELHLPKAELDDLKEQLRDGWDGEVM